MNSQYTAINCTALGTRTSFENYIQVLNATTGFIEILLQDCKSEICGTVYGDGNADISGIGMMVGYILESILGLFFATGFLLTTYSKSSYHLHNPVLSNPSSSPDSDLAPHPAGSIPTPLWHRLLEQGTKTFFDSAVFFVASIQISSMIVLIRKDYGISGDNLGDFTVQIAWAIALLCILPLLYPLVILQRSEKEMEKKNYRLFLFGGCAVPFLYTFCSLMVGNFGKNQVGVGAGDGGKTIITDEQMSALENLCLSQLHDLSTTERAILNGFSITASLILSTFFLFHLGTSIISKRYPSLSIRIDEKIESKLPKSRIDVLAVRILVVLVPFLSVPAFWGVFRLRGIQRSLAGLTNREYVDNQWGFGQVVAVMLFVPVFTEMGYLVLHQHE